MTLARTGKRHLHDGLRRGVDVQNDRFTNFSGQFVANSANGVAHFIGCFDHVLFEVEGNHNAGIALIGSATNVFDAIDRLQGFLNAIEHRALDRVG